MSKQTRERARTKVGNLIDEVAKSDDPGEELILKEGLGGLVDLAFGIWKALEEIATSVSR